MTSCASSPLSPDTPHTRLVLRRRHQLLQVYLQLLAVPPLLSPQGITDIVDDPWMNLPNMQRLKELKGLAMKEFFPHGARAGLEA